MDGLYLAIGLVFFGVAIVTVRRVFPRFQP
jgi:hypothetical protein